MSIVEIHSLLKVIRIFVGDISRHYHIFISLDHN